MAALGLEGLGFRGSAAAQMFTVKDGPPMWPCASGANGGAIGGRSDGATGGERCGCCRAGSCPCRSVTPGWPAADARATCVTPQTLHAADTADAVGQAKRLAELLWTRLFIALLLQTDQRAR